MNGSAISFFILKIKVLSCSRNTLWRLSARRAGKRINPLHVGGVVVNFRRFLVFTVLLRWN
jgi:hypothetical protein